MGKRETEKQKYCNKEAEMKKQSLFILKRENATRVAAEKTRLFGTKLQTHSQQMVVQLKETRESVITDIFNARCQKNIKEYHQKQTLIVHMLEEMQRNKFRISSLTSEMLDTKKQCDKINRIVILKNLEIKALHGHSKTEAQMEKKIENLENNLYIVTVRTNVKFTRMDNLREEIRNLLIYRGICYKRLVHYKKELKTDSKRLRKVMHQTKENFITRDDLIAKAKNIRESEQKDIVHFQTDLTELGRVYAEEDEYEEFIITKNQERDIMEDEILRKKRIESTRERKMDLRISEVDSVFKKLYSITKTQDVKEMVQFHKEQEERNRSEVLILAQKNANLEETFESVVEIKRDIENHMKIQDDIEFNLIVELKRAEAELKDLEEKVLTVELNLKDQEKHQDYFVFRMKKLFGMSKCDLKLFTTRLEIFRNINMKNMPLCIKALEKHFASTKKELRKCHYKRQKQHTGMRIHRNYRRNQLPVTKLKSQGGPYQPKFVFAKDIESDDEATNTSHRALDKDEEMPLTYAEAKAAVLEEMRENQGKQGMRMGISFLPTMGRSVTAIEH